MERLIWLLCPLILSLAACNDENPNDSDFLAGKDFTGSNIRVVLIDTLTLETSTMKFDSIVTGQSTRMLVGKYVDPVFGAVSAASHLGLVPAEYAIDAEAKYDSIAFHLAYDGYYYNDTTRSNTIQVKRLLKTLRPVEGDDFYNSTTVTYNEDELGSFSYKPRPLEADTLEIRLSDNFGADLFEKLQDKLIINSDEFIDYFKGIALVPGENDDGSIIGFSKEPAAGFVRLYFSTDEENEQVQDYIDFGLNLSETPVPFFNQITTQDPIEPLTNLNDQEVNLNSSDADGLSFIQSGVGIACRIQFPYIKNIYDIKGQGTIMDAVLRLKPKNGTYNDQLIIRDELLIYVVDRNNNITEQLSIDEGSPITGILNRDNEEFNDIYYEIPLASYLDKLLSTELETNEALVLLPNGFNSTVDRFVLNGSGTSSYSAKLELIYAIYDEDND
ncbi:DUF4270 family protein [Flagellimonas pacifica]|uniref:DUF4270 domain-containing protein n=1 Tax=Flagellimonas pacifica TaxID=1247520 RepID=A0A285N0C6_9FLAO|nr:DUF4270 family protein [Allomuricauda parva]SNZ01476.1 protein of unknown function [Allomuricauda parva]